MEQNQRSGTTFFFPFVITFAVLFSMLVAGVIRARRRARYLRVLAEQRGINIGRGYGYGFGVGWWGEPFMEMTSAPLEELETPEFRERQAVKGDSKIGSRWEQMAPLSVLSEMPDSHESDRPLANPSESQSQSTSRSWSKPLSLFKRKNIPDEESTTSPKETPLEGKVVDTTFQICVLIEMPSQIEPKHAPVSYFEDYETVFGTHTTVKSGWPRIETQ